MGLTTFFTSSVGKKIENPRLLNRAIKNLKRKHRQLSKKQKDSANRSKARKQLARAIADASWYSFVSKLEYKAKIAGKHLIKVNQWFASSKTCSCCGYKKEQMPLNIHAWTCPSCHATHDRDVNAAKNLLKQGIIELKAAGLSCSPEVVDHSKKSVSTLSILQFEVIA